MSLAVLLLVILGGQVPQPGVALRAEPSIALSLEHDSNARRLPAEGEGSDVVDDQLLRAAANGRLEIVRRPFLLRADGAGGLKLFFHERSERMVVGQLRLQFLAGLPTGAVLSMSTFMKSRAQLSGSRSYGLLRSDAVIDRPLMWGFSIRAGLTGQAFHAFDNALFSSTGGSVFLAGRLGEGAEYADLLVDAALRGFPFASKRPEVEGARERRIDTPLTMSLQAVSARRLYLQGSWTLTRNESNARGESWTRHRLQVLAGTRLPAEATITTSLALQWTSYDDGISLGQRYFLADDDETQNVLDVMLSRPLFAGLILEGRLSFMGNELARDGARFYRQTASIGLRANL